MRRTGFALLTVLVALGGVVLLLLVLQGRDSSQLHDDGSASDAPGQPLAAQQLPADVRADGSAQPDDTRLLDLLERGNVVLLYGTARPPPALRALARQLAGPSSPALEASGQAVVLVRRPGVDGVTALAWRRVERASTPADPALRTFAAYWLGRGADG